MKFGPIFPIFGEDLSFGEELAADFGDFSRQSLRDQECRLIVVVNCAIASSTLPITGDFSEFWPKRLLDQATPRQMTDS
jgi:hypothetical protein